MKMKIKWRVEPELTGRYRSFERRGWPTAEYSNQNICAAVYCEDDYYPADVKTGNHKELTLRIADYRHTPWKWVKAKHKPKTLKEAKELLQEILKANPEIMGDNK